MCATGLPTPAGPRDAVFARPEVTPWTALFVAPIAVPVVAFTAPVAPVTVLLSAPVVPVAADLIGEGLLAVEGELSFRGAFLVVGGDVEIGVAEVVGDLRVEVDVEGDLGVEDAIATFSETGDDVLGVDVMAIAFCLTEAVDAGDLGGGEGIFLGRASGCCVDVDAAGTVDFFATAGLIGLDFVELTGEERSVAEAEALSAVVLGGDLVRIIGTGFLLPIGECVDVLFVGDVGESGVGLTDLRSDVETREEVVFCAAVVGADLTAGTGLVGEIGDLGLFVVAPEAPVLGMVGFFAPSATFDVPAFRASFCFFKSAIVAMIENFAGWEESMKS